MSQNVEAPVAERKMTCPLSCHAHCADLGVVSSIPFAALGRTVGVSV